MAALNWTNSQLLKHDSTGATVAASLFDKAMTSFKGIADDKIAEQTQKAVADITAVRDNPEALQQAYAGANQYGYVDPTKLTEALSKQQGIVEGNVQQNLLNERQAEKDTLAKSKLLSDIAIAGQQENRQQHSAEFTQALQAEQKKLTILQAEQLLKEQAAEQAFVASLNNVNPNAATPVTPVSTPATVGANLHQSIAGSTNPAPVAVTPTSAVTPPVQVATDATTPKPPLSYYEQAVNNIDTSLGATPSVGQVVATYTNAKATFFDDLRLQAEKLVPQVESMKLLPKREKEVAKQFELLKQDPANATFLKRLETDESQRISSMGDVAKEERKRLLKEQESERNAVAAINEEQAVLRSNTPDWVDRRLGTGTDVFNNDITTASNIVSAMLNLKTDDGKTLFKPSELKGVLASYDPLKDDATKMSQLLVAKLSGKKGVSNTAQTLYQALQGNYDGTWGDLEINSINDVFNTAFRPNQLKVK